MSKNTSAEITHSYDRLATHWNGNSFNRCNGMDQHLRAIRFSKKSGDAIDIGCGSSGRIIDLFLSSGFTVEGLDISTEMINLARQRHPHVIFHLADIVSWVFPKKYDFISAWDSIWHVVLDEQESVLRKLCAALVSDGVLIFTSGGVDKPDQNSNIFLGQPLYHAALGIPKLLDIISSESCVCRHLEYDQAHDDDIDSHLYLIVQKCSRTEEN